MRRSKAINCGSGLRRVGYCCPVLRNLGEQSVLDGIPFGGAGRVVSDGDGDAKGIADLSLKFDLPSPGSATVAAAGVGQNQKLGCAAITTRPFPSPPGG